MDKVVLILESLVDFSEAYTEKRENLFPVMQKNRFDVRLIICAVQCGAGHQSVAMLLLLVYVRRESRAQCICDR